MFHRPPLPQWKALPARIPLRGVGCVPTLAGDHDSALPTSRLFEIRCFLRDPALPAVSKDHPDPANPATRPACADLKLLTIEWMPGVDDPNYWGSRSDTVALRRVRRLRMTVVVIDRLVHHATIFEMNVESYRRRAALERKRGRSRPPIHAAISANP
jgi:hypothetical protein